MMENSYKKINGFSLINMLARCIYDVWPSKYVAFGADSRYDMYITAYPKNRDMDLVHHKMMVQK